VLSLVFLAFCSPTQLFDVSLDPPLVTGHVLNDDSYIKEVIVLEYFILQGFL